MAVTILQKQEQVLDAEVLLDATQAERVDAYGSASEELAARLKELEPLQNLVKELKNSLLEDADELAANEVHTFSGHVYAVELGKKAMKVVATDKTKLRETLGDDTFFELADVGIGDIRKYCTPPQIEEILAEEQIGPRRVKVKNI